MEFVADDRKSDSLAAYYAQLTDDQTAALQQRRGGRLNSKIMSIKRKAGGFRNQSNFTTAIYFHCGGLDLYPR